MRILLTGSTGFLGRHLVPHLTHAGHEVVPYTRDTPLIPDIADEELGSIDIILHAAAEITHKHLMFESNVVLTHKLLQFAARTGVKRFIYVGSSSEYGNLDQPRKESSLCTPNDYYGATKLAGTALCQGFAAQGLLDTVIARPFSLYGPNDTARKLIPRLIESAYTGNVVKVSTGSQHDFVYVEDFVEGLILLVGAPLGRKFGGDVVNFGTGSGSSNLDVVNSLISLGIHPNISLVEGGLGVCRDVPCWVADPAKALSVYGWKAKTSLVEGLDKTHRVTRPI